jgi:hypothetical protein
MKKISSLVVAVLLSLSFTVGLANNVERATVPSSATTTDSAKATVTSAPSDTAKTAAALENGLPNKAKSTKWGKLKSLQSKARSALNKVKGVAKKTADGTRNKLSKMKAKRDQADK